MFLLYRFIFVLNKLRSIYIKKKTEIQLKLIFFGIYVLIP